MVDQITALRVTTYTSDLLDISRIRVTPTTSVTGQLSIFDIQFTTTNAIPNSGYIILTLPVEIPISDRELLKSACLLNSASVQCQSIQQNPDKIKFLLTSGAPAN